MTILKSVRLRNTKYGDMWLHCHACGINLNVGSTGRSPDGSYISISISITAAEARALAAHLKEMADLIDPSAEVEVV